MKKILFMMVVIVGFVGGCKKEDKTDSMLNKIYGYRTLKTYTVNGLDSLSTFKDSLGLQFNFSYDEVDYRNVLRIDDPTSTEIKWTLVCTWWFSSDKYILINTSSGPIGTGPLGNGKKPYFEIVSLDKELILKTTYGGVEYYLVLG